MNDTTTDSSSSRSRKKPNRALIAGIAVAVAVGGWYGYNKFFKTAEEESEYVFGPVTTGDIEDLVTATGTLEPRDFVDVGAQVSGQIEQLYVEVGDVVTKGQELAKIDATTSQARMEATRASLESAKNTLKTQEENLIKSERDFQRQKNLLEQDATTQQAFLDAETAYKNAVRQKTNSELQIRQQEATMRIDEKNLGFTTIVAPIDGTVMSIAVKEGQTVNASQNVPVVMKIANLATMTVKADVSEADEYKLYTGIPVYFTTLGGQNRRWYSKLKRIEPTPKVQNSVVLYPALFDVENDGGLLKPSMTAQVFFVAAEARNVLMVPMAALQQGQQIAREMAQKEREAKGEATPGGPPGMPGAPAGAAAPAAGSPAGAAAGAAAPAATANAGAPAVEAAAGEGAARGNRPNGEGMRNGFPGGARPGGAGGPPGGFSPEQIEQFRRMRAGGGQGGGFGGQGGGFGGQRPGGFGGMSMPGGGAGASRTPQQRRGTVMVKQADGSLEPRQVVIGVTNRVYGEVLEGLKEGEEVVIAKSQEEAAVGSAAQPNANQQNRPPNFQGGFPGGGRPF